MTRNKTLKTKMKENLHSSQSIIYVVKGHIKPNCPQNQNQKKKFRRSWKETKKTYIDLDGIDIQSSDESNKEKEANIYFMEKHEDDEVIIQLYTSHTMNYFTFVKIQIGNQVNQNTLFLPLRLLCLPLNRK